MAKQTFTTGSVLTATQMNNLQANDYNWSVDSKSASYVLVAADAGKRIEMNAAGATTITVNTGLFTAGDMVYISNIGAGTCTVTAGTATVNKATNASLALAQYQSGMLYFVSASSAIFYPFDIGSTAAAASFSLLGTGTLTGATTITVSGISGMNKLYVLCETNGGTANASSQILLRLNADSGANYFFQGPSIRPPATITSADFSFQQTAGDTSILLTTKSGNAASVFTFGAIIEGCNSSGIKMLSTLGSSTASGGNNNQLNFLQGYWNNSATVSSVSIISGSGNFNAGTYKVYGSAV